MLFSSRWRSVNFIFPPPPSLDTSLQDSLKMDPAKASAATWSVPETCKRFLGFCNFYHRFIRSHSLITAPLSAVMSPKARFETLKSRFASAPPPHTPELERQFIVEGDTSNVGLWAILSQCALSDQKFHPCPFFSCRLNNAELI